MSERGLYEKTKGSGVWWIRFADEDGKIRRESIGTKTLARQVLASRRLAVAEKHYLPEKAKRQVTLEDWVEEHGARSQGLLRDQRHRTAQLGAWVKALGSKKLRALTTGDVERFLAGLRKKGKATATVNRYHAALKRCLNVARDEGLLEMNPAARVKLVRENNARTRYLTHEEEVRLLQELPPHEAAMVLFATHTGMRQGEQFGLRWGHLSTRRETAWIPQSKSGQGRWVRLNVVARDILRRLSPDLLDDDRVFRVDSVSTVVRGHFKAACKRAGIEGVVWHDLRHTFASRLVIAGESLVTVQQLLGHKTPMMTLRYAHLSPGRLQDAVEGLCSATDTGASTKTL